MSSYTVRLNSLEICIIGAGLSGLCAAKHLKQKGFKNIVIFEATSQLGGLWNYKPDRNYPNALYKNLTTNLPHSLMQYPDLPFPNNNNISKYPHHSVVLNYIKCYVDFFKLNSFIKYNHKVIKLIAPKIMTLNTNKLPEWLVHIQNTETGITMKRKFDSVIVCNGHYTTPYIPNFLGLNKFKKAIIHSRYYREPSHELFDHKTIVVIGYKSSGLDLGIEIFFECKNVKLYQVTHGVKVNEKMNNKHFIKHDRFIYKENISHFGDNSSLHFTDGDMIYPDTVILCTGYLYDFKPFLQNESLTDFKFNKSVDGLYQQMVYPRIPSLFFTGLSLVIVPALVVHFQCLWIANILSDLKYSNDANKGFVSQYLPTKYEMIKWMKINKQMSGKKEQFVLGDKQFDYVEKICLLAKEQIPSNLEKLEKMYLNKQKPMPYIKSKL